MPEEIELDVREQQEKMEEIHHVAGGHKPEGVKDNWARNVSLSTALLAVIAALAALESGSLVNEALLEQNQAVKFQAQASDKWSEYQSDSIKARSSEQTVILLNAMGAGHNSEASKFVKDAEHYNSKKEPLSEEAKKLEAERNKQEEESAHHMHQHHTFAYCVTFTQVAIALSAIAALTRKREVWWASLIVGIIGLGYLIYGFLLR